MPARLYDPLVAAACDEKNGRMASPGVADMLKRSTVMSKSKSSTRARYCTASTMPQAGLDPERAEVLDVRRMMRLKRRLVDQEFDLENLTVRQHPLAVLDGEPGVLQAIARLCAAASGPVPIRPTPAARRAPEHLVRHLAAKRLQQLEFFRRRRPVRHHVRILERRMGARIGAVHDGLVGPFEIERQDQRLAHPRIPELVAAEIDEPALRARRRIVGQDFALDPAILDGREIIARRPEPRR